jgi:transcriptional regulator with XRE-family HTH domain
MRNRTQRELLGALIRDMRTDAGLRQEELAQRVGRQQSFVSKIETGERGVDVLELFELCKASNVSPMTFMARLENQLSTSESSTS